MNKEISIKYRLGHSIESRSYSISKIRAMVKNAYTHTSGGFSQKSDAMLRMKDGKIREFNVEPATGDALGMLGAADMGTELATRTKTVCNKWVNAINQQLRIKSESQTEKLDERIRKLEKKLKEKRGKGYK